MSVRSWVGVEKKVGVEELTLGGKLALRRELAFRHRESKCRGV